MPDERQNHRAPLRPSFIGSAGAAMMSCFLVWTAASQCGNRTPSLIVNRGLLWRGNSPYELISIDRSFTVWKLIIYLCEDLCDYSPLLCFRTSFSSPIIAFSLRQRAVRSLPALINLIFHYDAVCEISVRLPSCVENPIPPSASFACALVFVRWIAAIQTTLYLTPLYECGRGDTTLGACIWKYMEVPSIPLEWRFEQNI